MATEFQSYDVESVEVASSEDISYLASRVWNYNHTVNVRCGQMMDVNPSGIVIGEAKTPVTLGAHVTYISKLFVDAGLVDQREQPVETYKILRGVEYLIPESNIHSSETVLVAGDFLVNNDGYFDKKTNATDFVVFQVMSRAVRGGGGYFRVMGVCSQIA